jgi:hypothetical protein
LGREAGFSTPPRLRSGFGRNDGVWVGRRGLGWVRGADRALCDGALYRDETAQWWAPPIHAVRLWEWVPWRFGRTKVRTKAKCGGFSTSQQTVRLSVASVEMTRWWAGRRGLGWVRRADRALCDGAPGFEAERFCMAVAWLGASGSFDCAQDDVSVVRVEKAACGGMGLG